MFLTANEIVKKFEVERAEYKIRLDRMRAEIQYEFEEKLKLKIDEEKHKMDLKNKVNL